LYLCVPAIGLPFGLGGGVAPSVAPAEIEFNGDGNKLAQLFDFIGERDGIRTHDLLIKSQMLYQLSYALPKGPRKERDKGRGWSSLIVEEGQ